MNTYLDHAATTPIRPSAAEAWMRTTRDLAATPGNPAALHSGGRTAKRILEDAREKVAHALGADIHEVIFTSGATESDALGVMSAARGARRRNANATTILASGLEHDAVAHQREVAEREGFTWQELPVDAHGITTLNFDDTDSAPADLALGTMTLVCSEIGSIQPLTDFTHAVRNRGGLVHSDVAQAIPILPISFTDLGLDLMSMGGHKVGAPVGIGALIARRGLPFATDRPGGGHERKIRSGTPDVAGACALAVALEECVRERAEFARRCEGVRAHLLAGLPDHVEATIPADVAVPSIVHLSVPTTHPEALLMAFDMAGIMVSAGSACHAGVTRPSEIVMRMGRSEEQALGVLRLSFGHDTSRGDIDRFLEVLPVALRSARTLDQVRSVADSPRAQ